MFASVVTMLWPGTQLDSSIQFSAIPCYLFIFHDLRVTQVLYESSGWCCSHSSLPSHGLGPHAFLCSTESHIFLQVSSNSATKCMWVWMVGYMSVWTFWWTGQSLLETVILPLNFLYLAHQKLSLNLFTDKASTPSLRSSLFHIYGCSLPCIYSANHCWLTQKTLFLK